MKYIKCRKVKKIMNFIKITGQFTLRHFKELNIFPWIYNIEKNILFMSEHKKQE